MTQIDDYLASLRATLQHMASDEREAILAEIRDHLEQESERLRNLEPGMDKDVAVEQAIESFGPADEIAVAYGADHERIGVINQRTGERLLDVAIVTGRVAGKVVTTGARGLRVILKYGGIGALAILGVAMVLAVAGLIFAGTVVTVFDDDIRESIPRPLYSYHESWYGDDEAETSTQVEMFTVRDDMKYITVDIWFNPGGGCVQVELIDPTGATGFDTREVCGGGGFSRSLTFDAKGDWTVHYTYKDYRGSAHVDVEYFEDASA